MTVSRVINHESGVRESTRQRVQAVIASLNYQPDTAARTLRGAQAFAIGLVYDDNPNANYVLSMQNGVLAACRQAGYELLIHPHASASPKLIDELCALAHSARLAGLVLTPPLSENSELLDRLTANGISFVRIVAAREDPDDGTSCVYVDDYSAAHAITTHLIGLGHRRIAFLWGNPQYHSSSERFAGYSDALRDHGIERQKKLVLEGTYAFQDGFRRARTLLARREVPTAIFGSNDEIAAGVLAAARSAGYDVPGDLSIAGFEDNPFSWQAWPTLTTARQSTENIARQAAAQLVELLRGADPVQANQGFTPELVVRNSTAPPRR